MEQSLTDISEVVWIWAFWWLFVNVFSMCQSWTFFSLFKNIPAGPLHDFHWLYLLSLLSSTPLYALVLKARGVLDFLKLFLLVPLCREEILPKNLKLFIQPELHFSDRCSLLFPREPGATLDPSWDRAPGGGPLLLRVCRNPLRCQWRVADPIPRGPGGNPGHSARALSQNDSWIWEQKRGCCFWPHEPPVKVNVASGPADQG